MCLPSIIDDSLAPDGCHVMSLFCQHFNPDLPEGQSWDEDVQNAETYLDYVVLRDTFSGPDPLAKLAICYATRQASNAQTDLNSG